MSILLDTHALLWYLADDKSLGKKTRKLLSEPEHRVMVSIASYWEIAIKKSLGKLKVASVEKVFSASEKCGFTVLPILDTHLTVLETLPFHHRDPFDRLLIAQAISDGLTVATRDRNFSEYEIDMIW